ncbi:hypothetical protein H5410_010710 [Solanum commersonii]|uniref:Uncharacterized protein n=1 Tax=Solanum commersonii TaxID=4109 RepID=A0A9J6AMA9_SOLCO|nr:hypothetical protein H5410_010710 [Solanum commersonii]
MSRSWWDHHVPSIGLWGRPHPKEPSPPTHLTPSPVDNVVPPASSPTYNAAPSPVDDVVSLALTTSCINMDDNSVSDLITSVIYRKIPLSMQCCKIFAHSKRSINSEFSIIKNLTKPIA